MDDDNEVRDRATFYLSVLEQKQKALNAGYILNGILSSLFIAFFKKKISHSYWWTFTHDKTNKRWKFLNALKLQTTLTD